MSLEIEGDWVGSGFVASRIDELPGQRRPKLRGPIGSIDHARGSVRMYGVDIGVDALTEFVLPEASLSMLLAGTRAEISCSVDSSGTWTARKIRLSDIKDSDKIKGVGTRCRGDGTWPDTLEVSGIPILVGRGGNDVAEGGAGAIARSHARGVALEPNPLRSSAGPKPGRPGARTPLGEFSPPPVTPPLLADSSR